MAQMPDRAVLLSEPMSAGEFAAFNRMF